MAVLTLACFVGYACQGIGKFASVYVPLESLAHWYLHSMLWLALAAAAIVTLRYTWYRFLPPPGEVAD